MWVALNSLEFIKILNFLYVLVVPILCIGNPRQGKSVGGDERCMKSNNNNTYNEGEGSSSNSDVLPTPWGTQMWVQIENNKRVKSQGTLPGSQHFTGVEGHARVPGWD
jgi:hypothetical protein